MVLEQCTSPPTPHEEGQITPKSEKVSRVVDIFNQNMKDVKGRMGSSNQNTNSCKSMPMHINLFHKITNTTKETTNYSKQTKQTLHHSKWEI